MNILVVAGCPRFIDFETVQVGPIELDIAHLEPEVASHLSEGLRRWTEWQCS
jgi:hypothetical protein